jgi:hypothetical protein
MAQLQIFEIITIKFYVARVKQLFFLIWILLIWKQSYALVRLKP